MHADLVALAQRGDREAFDELARSVGDRCMAIAFRILRDFDHADDAVQTALLTAWTEIRALRDPDRFEPWLHRILTNACYAEARRRRRWTEGIRLISVEPARGPDPYLTVDDRDQLARAFRRLTLGAARASRGIQDARLVLGRKRPVGEVADDPDLLIASQKFTGPTPRSGCAC